MPHSFQNFINEHVYKTIFFFFNDTATTEIYTLSLHDALPIFDALVRVRRDRCARHTDDRARGGCFRRSEEHTSELQAHSDLVCRLLLEKKIKLTSTYESLRTGLHRIILSSHRITA